MRAWPSVDWKWGYCVRGGGEEEPAFSANTYENWVPVNDAVQKAFMFLHLSTMGIHSRIILCFEGYPVLCRMFSGIPDLYLLDARNIFPTVATKAAPRHCQISPGRQNYHLFWTTALGPWVPWMKTTLAVNVILEFCPTGYQWVFSRLKGKLGFLIYLRA